VHPVKTVGKFPCKCTGRGSRKMYTRKARAGIQQSIGFTPGGILGARGERILTSWLITRGTGLTNCVTEVPPNGL